MTGGRPGPARGGDLEAGRWGVLENKRKGNILKFHKRNTEIKSPKRRGGRRAILFCHLGGSWNLTEGKNFEFCGQGNQDMQG